LRLGGVKGVAWRQGELAASLPTGELVNAAVTLHENEWREVKSLEFVAEAVRPAARLPLAEPDGEAPAPGSEAVRRAGDPLAAGERLRELPPGDPVAALERLAGGPAVTLDLSHVELEELEREALAFPTVSELRRGLVAYRRGLPSPYAGPKAERIARGLRELDPPHERGHARRLASGTLLPSYATGSELRRGLRRARRALPSPCAGPKAERIARARRELDLLDERGHARRLASGTRLSPYEAPSLLAGLVRRYRLRTFVHAYRHLD